VVTICPDIFYFLFHVDKPTLRSQLQFLNSIRRNQIICRTNYNNAEENNKNKSSTVAYKIVTKAIPKRLEKVIPSIISRIFFLILELVS